MITYPIKKIITPLALFFCCILQKERLQAQTRILSEAKLEYSISIKTANDNNVLADSIDGASLIVWMRGNQVRIDFNSKLRQQSTFYRNTDKSGVIIKFAGDEQFITELDTEQWQQYFYKTQVARLDTILNDVEQNGYVCQKLQLTRKDSTQVTVFITQQLMPLVKGYEPMFEQLDGTPISYYYKAENYIIEYQLKSIETIPISTSKFEVPKLSYKVLEYPKNNNIKKAYR